MANPRLLSDEKVKRHLSSRPEITFKRIQTIHDNLVQSHYRGAIRTDLCKFMGTFPCGGFSFCSFIDTNTWKLLRNGQVHQTKHFVNWKKVVVYLRTCTCHSFYIGKNKHFFWMRIREYVNYIKNREIPAPVARHEAKHHRYDPQVVKFYALTHVHSDIREADVNVCPKSIYLLQIEDRWIYLLNATNSSGLSDRLSFQSFLPPNWVA